MGFTVTFHSIIKNLTFVHLALQLGIHRDDKLGFSPEVSSVFNFNYALFYAQKRKKEKE